MKNDNEDTVEVENDDISASDKKPTFRYRRQYDDDVRPKSSLQKTLAFLKTWYTGFCRDAWHESSNYQQQGADVW